MPLPQRGNLVLACGQTNSCLVTLTRRWRHYSGSGRWHWSGRPIWSGAWHLQSGNWTTLLRAPILASSLAHSGLQPCLFLRFCRDARTGELVLPPPRLAQLIAELFGVQAQPAAATQPCLGSQAQRQQEQRQVQQPNAGSSTHTAAAPAAAEHSSAGSAAAAAASPVVGGSRTSQPNSLREFSNGIQHRPPAPLARPTAAQQPQQSGQQPVPCCPPPLPPPQPMQPAHPASVTLQRSSQPATLHETAAPSAAPSSPPPLPPPEDAPLPPPEQAPPAKQPLAALFASSSDEEDGGAQRPAQRRRLPGMRATIKINIASAGAAGSGASERTAVRAPQLPAAAAGEQQVADGGGLPHAVLPSALPSLIGATLTSSIQRSHWMPCTAAAGALEASPPPPPGPGTAQQAQQAAQQDAALAAALASVADLFWVRRPPTAPVASVACMELGGMLG